MTETILWLHFRDYKKIRDIKIVPPATRGLFMIGGLNAQGKTSLIEAMEAVTSGKRAQLLDPVRHGAAEADLLMQLESGLSIHRVVQPDGSSMIELRNRDGKLNKPQERIDAFIGARFLDPGRFISISAKEQRAKLLELIGASDKIAEIEARHLAIYNKRHDDGVQLTAAKGELDRLPLIQEVGVALDVAALAAEVRALSEKQRASESLGALAREALDRLKRERKAFEDATAQVDELQRKLSEAIAKQTAAGKAAQIASADAEKLNDRLNVSAAEWAAELPRREQLDSDLANANGHNKAVASAEVGNTRRREAEKLVAKLEARRNDQTAMLDSLDGKKLEILAAAKLPVEGLGVSAETITLNGAPFAQASSAEKLRVALALAVHASPNFTDIWMRDGALLDDNSLALLDAFCKEHDRRCWLEVVGEHHEGAVIIQDGMVKS